LCDTNVITQCTPDQQQPAEYALRKNSMIMPVHLNADLSGCGTLVTGESSLAERVRIRLLLEPGLEACGIHCHVFAGTAVLCGVVDSFQLRQRAQDALRRIPGLSLILNEIVVCPSQALKGCSAACG
jgi:hypothetical protein